MINLKLRKNNQFEEQPKLKLGLIKRLIDKSENPFVKLIMSFIMPIGMLIAATIWTTLSLGMQARTNTMIADSDIIKQIVIQANTATSKSDEALKTAANQITAAQLQSAKFESDRMLIENNSKSRDDKILSKVGEIVILMGELSKQQQTLIVTQTENARQIQMLTSSVAVLVDHNTTVDKSLDRQDRAIEVLRHK